MSQEPWHQRSGVAVMLLIGAVALALIPPARVPVNLNDLYGDFVSEELRNWGIAPDVIVIHERTRVFPEDATPAQWLRLHRRMPALRREVFDDFVRNNAEPVRLTLRQVGSTPVHLLSREESSRYFSGEGDGWRRFREVYPRSQGLMNLSRAGVSRDGRQALLYADSRVSGTGGGGSRYLLERRNGRWTIVAEEPCWQS